MKRSGVKRERVDDLRDFLKPVASNPLPQGPVLKAEDTEGLLVRIGKGEILEVLKELAGRGMEEPYKPEVLKYLALKLPELEVELEKAYREWAEHWDDLGLADLRSDYLVKGWVGGVGVDLFRIRSGALNRVHITTQRPEVRRPFYLNFLCGQKIRPFSGLVVGSYQKPKWRDPSALKGKTHQLCPKCESRLERMWRRGLQVKIKKDLDNKLEYIWLDERDQELIKDRAANELSVLLERDMQTVGSDYHPYDPPVKDAGDSAFYIDGKPLSVRIRQLSQEAVRRAYAERTLAELDAQGDAGLLKVMPSRVQNPLRAWEGNHELRLVDLLEADDLYQASLPHLVGGPFGRSFSQSVVETITRRAKAPAEELKAKVLAVVEARHQAGVENAEELERLAERELILKRLGLK